MLSVTTNRATKNNINNNNNNNHINNNKINNNDNSGLKNYKNINHYNQTASVYLGCDIIVVLFVYLHNKASLMSWKMTDSRTDR